MPTESRRERLARLKAEENESITTTYRSTFGGPGGLSPESWRYRRLDDKKQENVVQHGMVDSADSGNDNDVIVGRVLFGDHDATPDEKYVSSAAGGRTEGADAHLQESLDSAIQGTRDDEVIHFKNDVETVENARVHLGQEKLDETQSADFHQHEAVNGNVSATEEVTSTSVLYKAREKIKADILGQGSVDDAEKNDEDTESAIRTTGKEQGSHCNSALDNSNAINRVASLISILTTGNSKEQLKAANDLFSVCQKYGDPVRKEAFVAGGAHVLQKLIVESGEDNTERRNIFAAALCQICKDKSAVYEISHDCSTHLNKLIGILLEGTIEGNTACCDILVDLINTHSDGVIAACAEVKAVRRFSESLGNFSRAEESVYYCLKALYALCTVTPESSLKIIAWSGTLPKLASVAVGHPSVSKKSTARITDICIRLLLLAICQESSLDMLSEPKSIENIASIIADAEISLETQTGAARILSMISSQSKTKPQAQVALMDYGIPRACEIIHQSRNKIPGDSNSTDQKPESNHSSTLSPPLSGPLELLRMTETLSASRCFDGNEAELDKSISDFDFDFQLRASCAQLIGNLVKVSQMCCHVVIFHAEILPPLIGVLTASGQCPLAGDVLVAANEYALSPTALS